MTDNDKVTAAQRQMQVAAKKIESMSQALAGAKVVKEFDSDRRKRFLACAMKHFLNEGHSAAAAECLGRASDGYGDALMQLEVDYRTALETIEQAEAQKIMFEAARSLLAVERAKIGMI